MSRKLAVAFELSYYKRDPSAFNDVVSQIELDNTSNAVGLLCDYFKKSDTSSQEIIVSKLQSI